VDPENVSEVARITEPVASFVTSIQHLTRVEQREKLGFVIGLQEAKYLAEKYWKHFFTVIKSDSPGDDFDKFLEEISMTELGSKLELLSRCIQFGKIAKGLLENSLDDYETSWSNDQSTIESLLDDFLTFNELVIMSQMMIDLVHYENIKAGSTELSLSQVSADLASNMQFCASLQSKI